VDQPLGPAGLVAAARALGIDLAIAAAGRLLAYLDAMLALNAQINLTAVRDRAQAIVLHALDGLAFARTGLHPHHVLDLGTGNGFPGVAIACLEPHAATVLMDRTGKKVRAIGSCLCTAGLDAVETLQLDAAQAPALRPELRQAFDLVTARAVGRPEVVAALAEPLCRPGGRLVLWLEAEAEVAPQLGRFALDRQIPYELPEPAARQRLLGVWRRR
jgi:16S rRNA (guanine527-N7)-methyltransferase